MFALTATGVKLLLQSERCNLRIDITYNICKGVCKEILVHLAIQYHLRRYGNLRKPIARELDVDELMVSQANAGDGAGYWKKWSSKLFFFLDVFSALLRQASRAAIQSLI